MTIFYIFYYFFVCKNTNYIVDFMSETIIFLLLLLSQDMGYFREQINNLSVKFN